MGEHRRTGTASRTRRGISRGPVVLVVVLVLLVAAVFGWFALKDRIADEGRDAAQACVEGPATLAVTADPDIAASVRAVAEAFDATDPVVRDHCVSTVVTETPSSIAADALAADTYDESVAGPRPALWIPASSTESSEVIARLGVDTPPRPLAASPVVLAVAPALADTLGAAAAGWGDIPRLAAAPGSLDAIGAVGWGSLRPALPSSSATSAALVAVASAVADGSAPGGTTADPSPLTAERASSPAVVSAVSELSLAATAATAEPPATTSSALDLMVRSDDPATAPVHAVPATEQQLYQRITEGQQLAAYRPSGATPVADHPAIVLSDADAVQRAAAAEFAEFAAAPDMAQIFVEQGFRTDAGSPPDTPGLSFPDIGITAAAPDAGARSAVLATSASPVRPASTTILLDVSGSMESVDGGATRLGNVTTGLRATVGGLSDIDRIGLWTYSAGLDGPRPYRILTPLSAAGPDARAAVDGALTQVEPESATSTYASVEAAYDSALQNWVAGGPNSVLLITDGPNDDTSISSTQFLRTIAENADPARPVRVDVVSLTQNSDIATLRALAEQTGGRLVETTSSDPELPQILAQLTSDR